MATMTTEAPSVRARLREALRERTSDADPKVLAEDLFASLSDDEIEDLAMYGLRTIAMEESRSERARVMSPQPTATVKLSAPAVRSSKGARVAQDAEAFRVRVALAGGEIRFLGDCDKRDLTEAVEMLQNKITGLVGSAAKLAKIRDLMPATGYVREKLTAAKIEAVFHA